MPKEQIPSPSKQTTTRKRSGKPTLRTIAELTGLAVTTISRALADDPLINHETRKRVRETAISIGYSPDRAAQRLKTGRTNVIGVLLDPHEEILGFGTSLLYGLTKALQGTAYHLIVMPNFVDTSNIEAVEYIVRNNLADGLIFTRTEPLDARVRLLIEANYPFVSHGRTEFSTPHPYVDYDNYAFAYEAARRLIAKGRQKLTIILPSRRLTFSQHMLHGFMTAVREAGIAHELPETVTLDSAAGEVRDFFRLRARQPAPPDGLICPGEVSAMASITGLGESGWALGNQYDIVAKQTSRLLSDIQPGVETIYEDLTAAGEQLGRLLIRRIADEQASGMQLLMPPQIGFATPSH
ncbi:LacI family transcriptional regulator [Rhizobium sp. CECT 9324]|uniref:LacI family transcriptional regulator n=1 Tax=Rhizobium sp. CECT 9324 TaxID=2845820 RepID=UPI001E55E8DA|nr:LacI family transcriptional regulator [Rhizobium sp. CECT 9324]CAH0342796.1 HTH-type transcriptional regulator RafR [Rhizobium sp. CECT 9324]